MIWIAPYVGKHRAESGAGPGSTFFVFRQFPVQRGKADIEQFRRFLFVTPGVRQGLVQVGQLLFAQERFKLSQRTIGNRICGRLSGLSRHCANRVQGLIRILTRG